MKVFVIGAHKTGTTSICEALEILGFRTSHWIHHEEITPVIKAGRYAFPILETYDAIGDLPIPIVFRELDAHYRGSRFILTFCETDQWIHSLENRRWWRGREHPIEMDEEEKMFYGITHFDREICRNVYDAHNAAVRAHFAGRPNDLLEFEMGAGADWPTLCAFLDRPIPSVPFPHANRRVTVEEPRMLRILKDATTKVGLKGPLEDLRDRFRRLV